MTKDEVLEWAIDVLNEIEKLIHKDATISALELLQDKRADAYLELDKERDDNPDLLARPGFRR